MTLTGIANATFTIVDGSICFDVGPLSTADIAELRRQHVMRLFDMIEKHGLMLESPDHRQRAYAVAAIFLEMADAIAHTIALAAREPNRVSEAASLSVGTQIKALTAVAKLSLAGCGSLNLLGDVHEIFSRIASLRPEDVN
jgi:hypothetical protein